MSHPQDTVHYTLDPAKGGVMEKGSNNLLTAPTPTSKTWTVNFPAKKKPMFHIGRWDDTQIDVPRELNLSLSITGKWWFKTQPLTLLTPEGQELAPRYIRSNGLNRPIVNAAAVSYTFTKHTTPFGISINPEAFLNYNGTESLEPMEFTFQLCDSDGTPLEDYKYTIVLNLDVNRERRDPKVEVREITNHWRFDATQKDDLAIGELTIVSTSTHVTDLPAYVTGTLDIQYNGPLRSGALVSDLLYIDGRDSEVPITINGTALTIENLTMGQSVKLPIRLRRALLANPRVDKAQLTFSFRPMVKDANGTLVPMGEQPTNAMPGYGMAMPGANIPYSAYINILQDTQLPEVILIVNGIEAANGSIITLEDLVFEPFDTLITETTLVLGNKATDDSRPGAGINIRRLGMQVEAPGNIVVADAQSHAGNIDRHFVLNATTTLQGTRLTDSVRPVFIANGTADRARAAIEFSSENISNVGSNLQDEHFDYRFTTQIKVSLEYQPILGVGDEPAPWQKYEFTICQPMYVKPINKWLCVDYGTSAIVCSYDGEIIDLRERKGQIIGSLNMNAALKADSFESDGLEGGKAVNPTKFLSSDILLHNVGSLFGNDVAPKTSLATEQPEGIADDQLYHHLAVFLSPTSAMYADEGLRLLPCLKLLVGNQYLPSNKNLRNYRYYRNVGVLDDNGAPTTQVAEATLNTADNTSLMRVDEVFKQSYETLFRYYISRTVPRSHIQQLVLTYPNTYTPSHLKTLEGIVRTAFKSLRTIEFVSESDAVAAYYLSHWMEYHKSSSTQADMERTEHILVYDMGAGTLDVSYIVKEKDANGHLRMSLQGKMGTCKAGNYLDFVLAEVLTDLLQIRDNELASTDVAFDEEVTRKRGELKSYVKSELKKKLKSNNRGETVKWGRGSNTTTVGDVIQHEKFDKFLKECTYEILRQFKTYMGKKGETLPVDTVLLSGRSCMLEPLRERLEKAVAEVMLTGFFDDDTSARSTSKPDFIVLETPVNAPDANSGRMKTAVAEGALEIASNFRREDSWIHVSSKLLYASFGIAYRGVGGTLYYREVINHANIPNVGEARVYEPNPVTLDNLNNVNQLTLIQSYLGEHETAEALRRKDYQFVTEMEEINLTPLRGHIIGGKLAVQLRIDDSHNIVVSFGKLRTRGTQPRGEDLQSMETKRSIWPVTIG